jgi:phenylalanyl-tRNA synthetase beta chain
LLNKNFEDMNAVVYHFLKYEGLCSRAENFSMLRRPLGPAASLLNPANVEYEVVRTTLVPGALKTLAYNKSISHRDGVKLFEISDVVLRCENEIGAKNARRLVALHAGKTSAFEIIHGLADRVMTAAQIMPEQSYAASSLDVDEISNRGRVARSGMVYSLRHGDDPLFFPGMCAEILLKRGDEPERVVGILGTVHPEVLQNFEILHPCSLIELDIDAIM